VETVVGEACGIARTAYGGSNAGGVAGGVVGVVAAVAKGTVRVFMTSTHTAGLATLILRSPLRGTVL